MRASSDDVDVPSGPVSESRASEHLIFPTTLVKHICSLYQSGNTSKMPTAVVTGANSGIGHAFANILISEVRQAEQKLEYATDEDL